MSNASKKILLDATAGIREEYIDEAAVPVPKSRPLWVRFAAAAAALALLLGGGLLLWPDGCPETEYTPFFAIRAYAQDGTEATLDSAGDTAPIAVTQSDLFPGKEVYILDVSLTDTQGNRLDLEDSSFRCFHRGKNLEPGQTDENLSVEWVEEGGFYGYRLIGWCEEHDYIDIIIRDKNDLILHQKTIAITFSEQYRVNMFTSYTYEDGLSTEALIAKLLDTEQSYHHLFLASSPSAAYSILRSHYGGFKELEQREDAASLLLQRWLKKMEQTDERPMCLLYDGYEGLLLAQTAYWRHLTEDEKAQIASYGVSRGLAEPEENWYFPGHRIFSYRLKMGEYNRGCVLEISYNGKTIRSGEELSQNEHFKIRNIYWSQFVPEDVSGWEIVGWFDEPTEVTLSVYDGEELVRRQVLLITPGEDRYDRYQIDILEQTP